MVVSIFAWIPSLVDATILFCLFASEVSMAKSIDDPVHWLLSIIFLLACAVAAFTNTYTQSGKRPENRLMFNLVRKRMKDSMWLIGSAVLILIAVTAVSARYASFYWVGITITTLTFTLFISGTIKHWNHVKSFIDNKTH